ncbi:MBL fold metallo-hydrolase [Kordiimonas aquimaris]|uniref:hypothetical protein n=1 Tax=Kordiimonas aquimaris TaxID=707591 RepID=UPI0021CFE1F4|nr:hypothetical protein [Kordiimonas aquimaris]
MRSLKILVVNSFLLLMGAMTATAEGAKDDVIDRAVEAYGGENFTNMDNLIIADRYKGFRFGQSNSPDFVDAESYDARISVDFENKRKSFQWVTGRKDAFSVQHQVFDGTRGFRLNRTSRTITENASINFATVDRQVSYLLDTVLLKLLVEARGEANYLGKENYQGKLHDKISFQAEGSPVLTLFIEEMTGLISAMTRPHWREGWNFVYQYSDHEEIDGIVFAQDTYVTRGGQPFNVLLSRSITINNDLESDFVLPTGYAQEAAVHDFSEMSVKQLSDEVFIVGKVWGFSIFIDVGDYYVASGGYSGLKERFEAVRGFTGLEKPLKYQIVSHHHLDHLGGMQEAAELGATFVTVSNHVQSIKSEITKAVKDDAFMLIDKVASLAGGAVEILDIPSGHTNHGLVTYVPSIKTVFSADTFLSRQISGAPSGYVGLDEFRAAIAAEGWEVDHYAAAHSGRVLTAADLDSAINNILDEVCPTNWRQCERYR